MKEKLIELLNTMIDENKDKNITTEIMADYLIQNGVIVPPCKVGDIVYEVCDIESVHRRILEMEVLVIELSSDKEVVYLKATKKYLYNYGNVTFDDFGKTVFLTKEEAERALKERIKEYKGE